MSGVSRQEQYVEDLRSAPVTGWIGHQNGIGEPRVQPGQGIWQSNPSGAMRKRLIGQLCAAQQMVVACTFLLADRTVVAALQDAVDRGVRVYLLLASEARLKKEPREDAEFDQKCLEEHKQLLDSLAGRALVRTAEHFHAKFVLVDPLSHPAGMLLTANLTEEALTRNSELAVELTPKEVQGIFAVARWAFWQEADHELVEKGRLPPTARISPPVPPPPPGLPCTTSKQQTLRQATLDLIRGAQRTLVLANYGWMQDHAVVTAVLDRCRAGVQVTVLCRVEREKTQACMEVLAKAGIHVYGREWLHAKAILADDDKGLMMTANFEAHGMDQGFEIGVPLVGARAAALGAILRTWQAGADRLLVNGRRGDLQAGQKVRLQRSLKTPIPVIVEQKVTAPDITAKCAHSMEHERPKPALAKDSLPHQIKVTYRVHPPHLDKKAKKDKKRSKEFEVWQEAKRLVVAVNDAQQVAAAHAYAQKVGAVAVVYKG